MSGSKLRCSASAVSRPGCCSSSNSSSKALRRASCRLMCFCRCGALVAMVPGGLYPLAAAGSNPLFKPATDFLVYIYAMNCPVRRSAWGLSVAILILLSVLPAHAELPDDLRGDWFSESQYAVERFLYADRTQVRPGEEFTL